METVTFVTYACDREDLASVYLLAKSIRTFAGRLAEMPIRVYVPGGLPAAIQPARPLLDALYVKLHGTELLDTPTVAQYWFKPAAALAAERHQGRGNLIWLDRHMLVPGGCADLVLDETQDFAYRPPHLMGLGSPFDDLPDALWETLYRITHPGAQFPLYTVVDRQKIRPYFYAGHFAFRAEAGLMQAWMDMFAALGGHADMRPFLEKEWVDIYLHQIALTMAVLQRCGWSRLKPLPLYYGYPSHLHARMRCLDQAHDLAALNTAYFVPDDPDGGLSDMPVSPWLQAWIRAALQEIRPCLAV